MDEAKDLEKKIDKFNYDSIDDYYIKDKEIEEKTFTLLESETILYQKFLKKHEKCQFDNNGKNKFGPNGSGISITFTLTSLGHIAKCKCGGCKACVDITDYDSW